MINQQHRYGFGDNVTDEHGNHGVIRGTFSADNGDAYYWVRWDGREKLHFAAQSILTREHVTDSDPADRLPEPLRSAVEEARESQRLPEPASLESITRDAAPTPPCGFPQTWHDGGRCSCATDPRTADHGVTARNEARRTRDAYAEREARLGGAYSAEGDRA